MAGYHVHTVNGRYLDITPGDYVIDIINWNPLEVGYPGGPPDVEEHQTVLAPSTFNATFLEEHPVIKQDLDVLWDGSFLWNFTQGWKRHLNVDPELTPLL